MQTDLENFFHRAEHHYLQNLEMIVFRHQIAVIRKRLAIYECLRDNELELFQLIAEQLEAHFPDENSQLLERAIRHWIAVIRYCAMAMLLNNHDFLRNRLLDWLTDIIKTYKMQAIEQYLYELLEHQLEELFVAEQMALLKPFLTQAQTTLLTQSDETNARNTEVLL